MKRRDFIKFSALAATAAQANKIEGVTKTIFDQNKTFGANRFGLFWANTNSNFILSFKLYKTSMRHMESGPPESPSITRSPESIKLCFSMFFLMMSFNMILTFLYVEKSLGIFASLLYYLLIIHPFYKCYPSGCVFHIGRHIPSAA